MHPPPRTNLVGGEDMPGCCTSRPGVHEQAETTPSPGLTMAMPPGCVTS